MMKVSAAGGGRNRLGRGCGVRIRRGHVALELVVQVTLAMMRGEHGVHKKVQSTQMALKLRRVRELGITETIAPKHMTATHVTTLAETKYEN